MAVTRGVDRLVLHGGDSKYLRIHSGKQLLRQQLRSLRCIQHIVSPRQAHGVQYFLDSRMFPFEHTTTPLGHEGLRKYA